ncbi:MAG: 3-hydroxyacyl-CoA dehydrogenase NAD-binding domain-containing protein [Candidatus Eremiobacterota bacterium]
MDVRNVSVIGSGTMGSGIAQVFAQSGFSVHLIDISQAALDRAQNGIQASLEKLVSKGVLEASARQAALANLKGSTRLEDASSSQLVVEAVFEDRAVKSEVLGKLGALCSADAVLASNTSSISITELAAASGRPERFMGMHFMNPVPLMKLVELIPGERTDPAVKQLVVDLCQRLGKTPVECADYPGFLSNRILMPMINEAVCTLMEGVGTPEAIDTVMKLGMNHPMGPLALADLIGLDVCLDIMKVLHSGLGDKYRPCPLLCRMVAAGKLGKKSGQGFYTYGEKKAAVGAGA